MDINFTLSSFPTGYCFTTPNQFAVDLVARLAGEVAGDASFFNYGSSTPAPDFQDRPWIKLDASGNIDKIYSFSNGAWVARHPIAPGIVVQYEGSEASITTFDGGEVGAITATTGPMWEKVTDVNARFVIGPGTLPSGAIINVGDTGGLEEVELEEENIPIHVMNGYTFNTGANLASVGIIADDDRNNTPLEIDRFGGDPVTDLTVPHSNMPPYVAKFSIRRTARTHYRI